MGELWSRVWIWLDTNSTPNSITRNQQTCFIDKLNFNFHLTTYHSFSLLCNFYDAITKWNWWNSICFRSHQILVLSGVECFEGFWKFNFVISISDELFPWLDGTSLCIGSLYWKGLFFSINEYWSLLFQTILLIINFLFVFPNHGGRSGYPWHPHKFTFH